MTNDQVERMIEEHNRQIAEVWALFREQSREAQERQKKTDEQLAATDRKIDKLTDTWGRFIECFLAPGIPRAFQERDIPIDGTSERLKRKLPNGRQIEIDILGVNKHCVVAVEVKSTLRPEHIDEFLKKLPKFKQGFPEYQDRIVYGAVAGIDVIQAADERAINQGLWVITQRGDTVVIQNEPGFEAKTW